jgi:hypothetical protein
VGKCKIGAGVTNIPEFLILLETLLEEQIRFGHFGHEGNDSLILEEIEANDE